MRTLVLIRHGHALEGADDIARPLSAAGKSLVAARAPWLAGFLPDQIICSPATRTLETCELLRAALAPAADVKSPDVFYLADLRALLQVLNHVAHSVGTLWFVGHNPGLSDLASELTGRQIALGTSDCCVVASDAEDWATFDAAPCRVLASIGATAATP
jgi:phosphohistidine phosphatase